MNTCGHISKAFNNATNKPFRGLVRGDIADNRKGTNTMKLAPIIDKAFDAPVEILTDFEIECYLRGLAIERERLKSDWTIDA